MTAFLLQHGANPNTADAQGTTPLQLTQKPSYHTLPEDRQAVAELLQQAGATK